MKKIQVITIIAFLCFLFIQSEIYLKSKKIPNFDLNFEQNFKYKHFEFKKTVKKLKPEKITQNNIKKQNAPVPFKSSLYKKFGDNFCSVEIFFINPSTVGKPSTTCKTNACKALLENINNAETSIDFALYGIEGQKDVMKALLDAKERGVKIRGVTDSRPDNTFVYYDTKDLIKNFNTVSDFNTPYMHNKFFIFDKNTVFTGTMNISNTGSGGYNANTVLLIKNEDVVKTYTDEFEQMYAGYFQKQKQNINKKINCANGNLHIMFSPATNPYETRILPILKNAKKEIFVSIFYLTHNGIIEELINAKKRGVDVKIIYDAVGASNNKMKVKNLRENGIFLKVENWGGKNHEKNMVIDGKIFITGSANFSHSGMGRNDENILIFENSEIASFYREYFLKLYNSLDEKYLRLIPRAESFESINSCYDGVDNNFDGKIDAEDDGCKVKK